MMYTSYCDVLYFQFWVFLRGIPFGQSPALKQELFLDFGSKQNLIFTRNVSKHKNASVFFLQEKTKRSFDERERKMCDAHLLAEVNRQQTATVYTHFTYFGMTIWKRPTRYSFHTNRPIASRNVRKKTSLKRILIQFSNVILLYAIAKFCFLLRYQHNVCAIEKSERSSS